MKGAQTASVRLVAPIAVGILAVVLVIVIATSFGGSDSGSDTGRGGGGGGGGAAQTKKPKQKVYVVEPGDSLTTISDKTGVPVDRLTQLNPDLDPQALLSGQQVKLRR